MNTTQAPKPAAASASPAAPAVADAKLDDLFSAFRLMQLQHNRVVLHESEELSMGATDIRALFFIAEASDGATPKMVAESSSSPPARRPASSIGWSTPALSCGRLTRPTGAA